MFPRRIALIAGTLGKGGAERQLFYQATALHRMGIEVQVITLTSGEFWESELRRAGIRITYAGRRKSPLHRLKEIAEIIRRFGPDIVQSAHFYTNLYAWYAGKKAGVPSIGAVRNDCHSEVGAHPWPIGQFSLLKPDWIAVNSQEAMRGCTIYGRRAETIFYLPNVVDTKHFVQKTGPGIREEVTLMWCGRMVEAKQPSMFVRLILKLREDGFPVRGIMTGDGPLLTRVRTLLQSGEKLAGALHIVGSVDNTAEWYQKADILVLTSRHEGTPNVVLEAMSTGLAIVTTPVGGVRDLFGECSRECIASSGTVADLLKLLQALVGDHSLRLRIGATLRKRAETLFSLDILPNHLEALYKRVLRSRGSANVLAATGQ
ncbi:MAG: glycosyltransferase family 4 protein [Candidatus Sumerlaeaceae bacterium]